MTKRIFFIIVFICVALEVTFLNYFKIFSVKPDLSLIAVVFASLYFDLKWALILSIFVGLLKDTFSLNPFGIYTPLFALYSLLIARLSRKISLENNLILMVLVFIIVIFNNLLHSSISCIYSSTAVTIFSVCSKK